MCLLASSTDQIQILGPRLPFANTPWLVGQRGRGGTEASRRGCEAFLEVATRRFPSIRPVTQAEAWAQALPGPVTQFPQLCRAIKPHLLVDLEEDLRHGWYVSVGGSLIPFIKHLPCIQGFTCVFSLEFQVSPKW